MSSRRDTIAAAIAEVFDEHYLETPDQLAALADRVEAALCRYEDEHRDELAGVVWVDGEVFESAARVVDAVLAVLRGDPS